MRTIEAFWETDRLRVWGLDSALSVTTRSRARIPPHPYVLGMFDPERSETDH